MIFGRTQRVTTTAAFSIGATEIGSPSVTATGLPGAAVAAAVTAASRDEATTDRTGLLHGLAATFAALTAGLLAVAGVFGWGRGRREKNAGVAAAAPRRSLVRG